jgi:hypothetical protein
MRQLPNARGPGIAVVGLAAMSLVTMSLVTGCGDDDTLTLDEAADVDRGDAAVAGLFGAADVTFNGVTASSSGVTCSNDGRLVVSPIVTDTFTLEVDGDPVSGDWNVRLVQAGDPAVVWTATEPTVDVEADVLTGSAPMQRADDPAITAALAFVVDC